MRNKRIRLIFLLLLLACLTFNTLHAYDPPAFLTSPTPVTTPTAQGVPTATLAPTVATEAPTVPATLAATAAPVPTTVTLLPASGMHADWRPVMAVGALLFLAVSGAGLWYLRIRKINQRKMR